MATLVFVFVFARRPLARPPARPSVRRSASPILACKLLTSPRISCGVVRRPADSLRPTSLGPFANSITDYAQSGRCLQQQATSVSVLVVLHVLPVGQQLRTVASSSRIHWRAAPCLDWAFDLVSGVPYPTFFRLWSPKVKWCDPRLELRGSGIPQEFSKTLSLWGFYTLV